MNAEPSCSSQIVDKQDTIDIEQPSSITPASLTSYESITIQAPEKKRLLNEQPTESNLKSLSGKLIDIKPLIPTEELLGSVTTFHQTGGPENGHPLRTSARVIHKMRMDSIRGTTPPPQDKKELTKLAQPLPKTPSQSRTNRIVWSNADKNFFFEALNEYGKDFESIANYLNAKGRRKNTNETFKSKDVRQCYYQIFHKVSKYLQFSEDVKKEAQELYTLINYGEMRKKVPFMNKKYYFKLRDLVYKGMAIIREKGKNIRFKTPSCRALRKLNQLQEWQEEIKLPPKIDVILKPGNIYASGRVQNVAQNPRIKTTVNLQKRVVTLIQTLQHKWRSEDVKVNEKVKLINSALANATSIKGRIKAQHEQEMNSKFLNSSDDVNELLLCFAPTPSAVIHRPMVNLTEFLSSYNICLNSYEQRIGAKVRGETLCSEKFNSLKETMKTTSAKRQRNDSGCEKQSPEGKKIKNETKDVIVKDEINTFNGFFKSPNASNESLEVKDLESSDNEYVINAEALDFKSPDSNDSIKLMKTELENSNNSNDDDVMVPFTMKTSNMTSNVTTPITIGTTTSLNSTNCDNNADYNSDDLNKINGKRKEGPGGKCYTKKKELAGTNKKENLSSYRPLVNGEVLKKIREGWTIQNVGDLTFGDLYIMFGQEFKLNLEYFWMDAKKSEKHENGEIEMGQKCGEANSDSISNKLRQLLLVAEMKSGRKKIACGCGHVCDKKTRKEEISHSAAVLASSSGDSLIFKHPQVPVRVGNVALSNISMINSQNQKYKQSRWWRMRGNRPAIPNRPNLQSSQPQGQTPSPSQLQDEQPKQLLSLPIIFDEDDLKIPMITSTTIQNQSDAINSTNEECPEDQLTQMLEEKIKSSAFASSDSNLSLSLFDISLPSTSSSTLGALSGSTTFIGELVSDDLDRADSNLSSISALKILREHPEDEPSISDLSLSSFLGHLDSVYEAERRKADMVARTSHNGFAKNRRDDDHNMSINSESSVDYIARFEDIAAELRSQDPT